MKAGALFCGLCALALALTARAGTSLPGSTRPDEDPDADGLVNVMEAEAGTKPLEPDTDGDSLLDGAEAVPTSPAIRAPAAPETNYAIVELGPAEGVCGVNDAGEVLFVAPGNGTDTETGKFFRKGSVLTIGEGRAGSFAGPMLNGYVLFHAAEETQTTAGNATIRRRVRKFFHPIDFPIPAQSGYATERREWSAPVADPLPETAPASSMLTGLHGQQWAEVWANVRAQLLAQLAGYTPKPGTGIYQTLECELGELNDAADHTMEARFALHATYERAEPPGEIAFTLHIGMAGWKSVPDTYSAGAWQAVSAGDPTSQLPRGLKVNPSLFATAKMGNQTVRFQPWGSDIPLPEIESVIDLGDTISPEGPYLLAATANGTQLLAYNSGNPAGIPVPAPAGGGGGRETTGRKLSNRLVIPTGSGLWRNGRHLPWSRLGGSPSANSTWTAPQITHISPQNHIAAGTVTRLRDANGEPIPEEARQKYAALLLPADLAVDANRDGMIKFAGNPEAAGAYDRTEQSRPFRFWVNDDDDRENRDHPGSSTKDHTNNQIESLRDLEDFTRLHLHIGGLQDAIVAGNISIGLEWRNVTGNPSIKVYQAAEADGGDNYLRTSVGGANQAMGGIAAALGTVINSGSFKLPASFWQADSLSGKLALSAENPNRYLIFEGVGEGKGQLVITFWKGNGKIGEGGGVWLDLVNIRKMYQSSDDDEFEKPLGEEKTSVTFVHGWNMSPAGSRNFAETMFKRLWHRGFKGRFGYFRWNTDWSDAFDNAPVIGEAAEAYFANYNASENRAWKEGGPALKTFVEETPAGYTKNIAAHSMGNIVVGSALLAGMAVDNYAMMQAAVPSACYDDREFLKQTAPVTHAVSVSLWGFQVPVSSVTVWSKQTPDDDPDQQTRDLAYRGLLEEIGNNTNLVNFYLPADNATSYAWEINNEVTKPPAGILAGHFRYERTNPAGQKLYRDFGGGIHEYTWLSRYDAVSLACRTWAKAAGAEGRTQGSVHGNVDLSGPAFALPGETEPGFGDEHSGQFDTNIQNLKPFYDELMLKLNIGTPNP